MQYSFRAYRIENASVSSSTLAALEERYVKARMSVQRVQRGNEVLKLDPSLELRHGDLIVLSARRTVFADLEHDLGPEINDPVLLSVPLKSVTIVVTKREVIGKTIGKLALDPRLRGVYLESLRRGTELMPYEVWTVVERGDILRIVGSPDAVERAGSYAGFVERDLSRTDLTFLAWGNLRGDSLGIAQGRHRIRSSRARHVGLDAVDRPRGRMAAEPLSGVWRDTGLCAATPYGHRPDCIYRGGWVASGSACCRCL